MPGVIFALITVVVALAIAMLLYPLLIRLLRRWRVGQAIQETMSQEHQRKAGTPTGGGLLFVLLGIIGGLLSLHMHGGALPAVVGLFLFSLLGLADDLTKVRFRARGIGSRGIRARLKFPLQILCAIPVAYLAHTQQHFLPDTAAWGWVYWPLAVVVIAGAANGVNFNDGIDGLAGGTGVIALLGAAILLPGEPAGAQAVAFTLVGALLAFTWYNRYPARIFMGDTGSLGLGAALAAICLQAGWGILLLLLGIVYVVEVASVMIQVTFFKVTGGRRVFKDTPLHLTFQKEGWSENRIALTSWGVAIVAALASGWIAHLVS
ncbi:MAG: phospho-N-acetylmuramoyl-pentapeptide-transferase [Candidatus Dormibacteraceae bacterium]